MSTNNPTHHRGRYGLFYTILRRLSTRREVFIALMLAGVQDMN